jgi:hypothetical protein
MFGDEDGTAGVYEVLLHLKYSDEVPKMHHLVSNTGDCWLTPCFLIAMLQRRLTC